jgi:hypothetical protein
LAICLAAAPSRAQEESIVSAEQAEQPGSLVSTQWVRADASGQISGRVLLPGIPLGQRGGEVMLVDAQGEMQRGEVSPEGNFVASVPGPGVYTLAYRSPVGFGVMALHVAEGDAASTLASQTLLPASRLDYRRALATIARYLPPRPSGSVILGAPVSDAAGGVSGDVFRVAMSEGGGVRGRLVRAGSRADGSLVAGSRMNVLVLREGEVVGQTISDFDGTFEVPDLDVGTYDLIASGAGGFAAIGFVLTGPSQPTAGLPVNDRGERFASAVQQDGGAEGLTLQVAPAGPGFSTLGSGPQDPADGPVPPPLPQAPGGGSFAAGGGFGGVGGGGGGGMLGGGGGLLAAGGILAAVLATDDDDDGVFVPPVVSPAVP